MTSQIPDHFKTRDMCNKAVKEDPFSLMHVPDHFKTQDVCTEVVEKYPILLTCVPDHLKTQENVQSGCTQQAMAVICS